ncbi:WXG100 family type VII secretion target [Kitasatospora sp. NPDC002965]|uniref:WXG100 family type VII secretion target n=1 Tax=Kitasatospora sp. NPDC002965 TaxID=3154775 RepID=UPI00339DD0F6
MAGGTNFEGIEHARLKSMVINSDPTKVTSRGNQLKAASRVLDDLSRALAAHLGQIQWEGPAAESFKTWATDLNRSAAMISEYSKGAGDAMVQAGEALSTAKTGVPEPPKTDIDTVDRHSKQPCLKPSTVSVAGIGNPSVMTDAIMKKEDPTWVSYAEAAAAHKRVEAAHQEAIHQMEKLGQAYEAATTKLNGLKLPELPGAQADNGGVGDSENVSVGGGGSAGSGSSTRSSRSAGGYSGGSYSPAGAGYGGGGRSVAGHPSASASQGTGPLVSAAPSSSPGGSVLLPRDPSTSGAFPSPWYPTDRPGTGLDGLPPGSTPPGSAGPSGPGGGGPVPPHGAGGGPGYPATSGNGPAPHPGGAPVPFGGVGPFGGAVAPVKGGGGSVPPNRTGTFGGGNLPAGNGGSGPSGSGPVFGAREAQGRAGTVGGQGGIGGVGGGIQPGTGGYGGGSVVGGGSRGRGSGSTGGGVVGGQSGPVAGGEFTPGGSGLRNRGSGAGAVVEGGARQVQSGMMGPGMMGGTAERSGRDRRKRADYLHEDEETWTSGTPRSNPGVIE